jgi:hypothetical protein
MSWRAELDSLRRNVLVQTRNCVNDRSMHSGDEHLNNVAVAAAVASSLASVITHGWRLTLSRVVASTGGYSWHMSACLSPRGRKSTDSDWKWLGHFAAYLGAPKDPLIMPENATGGSEGSADYA